MQTLEEIHRAIETVLAPTPALPSPDLTDAVMESNANSGAARILDRLPVDPEDGTPLAEQYAHRGVVVTFPAEDNANDTRGRETEGMRITAVLHLLYRVTPDAQRDSTYGAWRWEEALRRRIQQSPLLHTYRPRYVGTRRGASRASAEWLTAAVTFTLYRNTWGG